MTVFVDTSAIYAGLDRNEIGHATARAVFTELIERQTLLITNNYVVVESAALLQNRLGLAAVRTLHEDILPGVRVAWVSEEQHSASVAMLLATGRRKLSLVDCVSFATMRAHGIRTAFSFDTHFREQGFELLP